MSSEWISYFGYGSLVNRNTRPNTEEAVNVTLKGWQRIWNHRVRTDNQDRRCTSLSIEPAAGDIQGVLVRIPASELAELDQRELGYQRLCLASSDFLLPEGIEVDTIYVYQSLDINRKLADDEHPIMQSYVDCVMAGYQARFGDDGLQRLLNSTQGWEKPFLNDRHSPKYPRSVLLPDEHLQHFDRLLASLR